MGELKIIPTGDGSHTLFNPELNETYHSTHGAISESRHVFIQNGLAHYLSHTANASLIRVFEMGFGTGLNAVLTSQFAEDEKISVEYYSIEAFPITREIVAQLNYFSGEVNQRQKFQLLHALSWNEVHKISDFFLMEKILSKMEQHTPKPYYFDVVYYDAFAPNKQEGMWSVEVLKKVISGLKPGGVFVTYCAKGQLKRDLKALGCEVETLPGPPGKKEMVRATMEKSTFGEPKFGY